MDLAGAAAVGGGGDDVLRGGRLTGGLLVQVFGLVLGCALRGRLLRLQLALTLGDDVVGLEAQEGSTALKTVLVQEPFHRSCKHSVIHKLTKALSGKEAAVWGHHLDQLLSSPDQSLFETDRVDVENGSVVTRTPRPLF